MPAPLIEITYLPPTARKRMLSPRHTLIESPLAKVVSLLFITTSQFENSKPAPSFATGSVTWIEPLRTRPTAEPSKVRLTRPMPALTDSRSEEHTSELQSHV